MEAWRALCEEEDVDCIDNVFGAGTVEDSDADSDAYKEEEDEE